ncbi:MAG: acetyl-CoA carboxylase biotin carboxyl carrier protein [Mariprofundaceae bacterium]
MDITKIRRLIKLIQSTDIMEIEVSEGDKTVRISRSSSSPVGVIAQPTVQYAASPASDPVVEASMPTKPNVPGSDDSLVKSPMVGTFYRSPSPETDVFISEGDRVKKGDILCIIEAMKLMNEIEAEYDGIVESILVDNATPIEFGQPLFTIRPA